MAKNEPKPIDALTYEEAFAELETIVVALESGERPLEESMTLFERGQALTKRCAELLDKAELKVQALVGESLTDFKESQ
ncbi:MAG: exodeoxyribonuclease VII small subunit [Chloroflexi bacterium]|nr:exodeoxyribonuclease VII small subunit [Chloroflexota bacterium]